MRTIATTLALTGLLALASRAAADSVAPPPERLIPAPFAPQPRAAEPVGDLAPPSALAAPLADGTFEAPLTAFAALERLPIWHGRGGFGQELYGLRARGTGSEFAVGVAPASTSWIARGYAAGFVWRHGRLAFTGDVLSGVNRLGRTSASSLLAASVRMNDDLTLLFSYHTRDLAAELTGSRESVLGGGLEMDF